jgi:hypothetical protein
MTRTETGDQHQHSYFRPLQRKTPTLLVLGQTVGYHQAGDTTSNDNIVVVFRGCCAKDGSEDDAEKLNGHSQPRKDWHLEIQVYYFVNESGLGYSWMRVGSPVATKVFIR